MNDPMMNEGVWPTWLQQAMWLEWLQPFLYALLALAVVSLVIALLDLALLCWKEFHSLQAEETTKARTKAAPVSEVKRKSVAALVWAVMALALTIAPPANIAMPLSW
ncbi:MAG: hypothetical protein JST84_24990 [Acidobacteria bacterium]|nr:hypothetical protein [Acidobacteriota bacterium]